MITRMKSYIQIFAFAVFMIAALSVPAQKAHAQLCDPIAMPILQEQWIQTRLELKTYVAYEFTSHKTWLVSVFWEDNVLPGLMLMTDQLSSVAMQQTQIIGSFLDAKHQMETQRVLQTIRAQAHKDYQPSNGMCEFGTSVKSLAASERKAELNAHIMSQRAMDRHLGNANTAAAAGREADVANRLEQFKTTFCDPNDNNAGLDVLCESGSQTGAEDQERTNKDIDYARTISYPWTLNIDFTDTELTDNEEEVLALANNLYGNSVFKRIMPATKLENSETQELYMDVRAHLAKQSVAENSFNASTSMKSAGTSGSREFLEAILRELGVDDQNGPPDDTLRLLGMGDDNDEIGPSYHAQMEVLTKKIYQNPDFYTNLYDKPANVERKRVALQAIGLMQKFDMFKSYLRSEANMAVLLELAISDLQSDAENQFSSQTEND